ncbi:MAG TPA: hypothetical protein VEU62_13105, partial [Bryobacterales bacterium]|nr:hypothetical protein [Bryobacterales bacterium]
MKPERSAIHEWYSRLPATSREHTRLAARRIIEAKQRGGKVLVATGSGPNIHEGVTTLLAELICTGVVDGIITSSAVVAHEMAGTLDRVKRVRIVCEGQFGLDNRMLPRGAVFEVTVLGEAERRALEEWSKDNWDLYDR